MTAIVYDFADIKRRARLRDTPKQDSGTPVIAPVVQDYGMYACLGNQLANVADADIRNIGAGIGHTRQYSLAADWQTTDTAPSEYCPPDFDPA